MKDMKITEFAEKYGACEDGVKWATRYCKMGMMSEAYDKLLKQAKNGNPQESYLWWVMYKAFDDKTLRLLSVRMVRETPLSDGRKVVDLLTDERSLNALVVAERFANGEASEQELAAARAAAGAAQRKIIADLGNPFRDEEIKGGA